MAQAQRRPLGRSLAAFLFVPLIAAGALIAAKPATAAPQAIALVASAEPVELRCNLGECGAEFTSFCLEKSRPSPNAGTPYRLHDLAALRVEGQTSDGATVQLSAADLTITSARGHTAVWMSLPAATLRAQNLASVRVSVAADATLLPLPEAGDPKAHRADEIARIAGPMRAAGSKIVDRAGEPMAAARETVRLVNLLPRLGRTHKAERDGLWAMAAPAPEAAGYALVKEGFDNCRETTLSGPMSLRQCLGSFHDSLISPLNIKYWRAMDVGS